MSSAPVQPGAILARKYRVDRVLGQGNMGVVVAATHVDLGQRVALKFMLGGSAVSNDQRERFLREARAVVRLKSHHVARVLDVGTLEDDAPYIVMEFLEGRDLAAVLAQQGPLPVERAVEYLLQACEAVGEAHAAGIVHRDLKPANLFLTHDVSGAPCIKVLDFGISKLSGGMDLTQTEQSLGSPLYMSPEQMNSSKDVDARADVWALGIVLFQLVAGKTPFHADTVPALCARVLWGAPTPLGEYLRSPPPGLEATIHRCIERDRDRRLPDVATLAAAIGPFAPATARSYPERVARVMGVPPSQPFPMGETPQSRWGLHPQTPAPPQALAEAPAQAMPGAPVVGTTGGTAMMPVVATTGGAARMSASGPQSGLGTVIMPHGPASSRGPASSQLPAVAASHDGSAPAPARSRAPLVLASAALALAAGAVAIVALRGSGARPDVRPDSAPTVAAAASAVPPPASTPADPAPVVTPAPPSAASPSQSAPAAPPPPSVAAKPGVRVAKPAPPATGGAKPPVSYDERN